MFRGSARDRTRFKIPLAGLKSLLEAKHRPLKQVPRRGRQPIAEPEQKRDDEQRMRTHECLLCNVERNLMQQVKSVANRSGVHEETIGQHRMEPPLSGEKRQVHE